MSEPQIAAPQDQPAPAAPPPAPPQSAAPDPAPAPAPGAPPPGDPNWLAPRLDQAKRSAEAALLASMGVKDAAELKAALDAYKAAQDAAKTEAERVAARIAEGDAAKARAAQLEIAIKAHAEHALAGLTDAQRAAVETLAAGDCARIVESVAVLRPTWATAPAAPPASPPPAGTAPAAPAPVGTSTSQPDHKAEFARLKATNPIAAANYAARHKADLWPAQP